jgi:cation transporter-like permease
MPISPTTPIAALATMWVRPRDTMRFLVSSQPTAFTIAVVVVHGFFKAIDRAVGRHLGDHFEAPTIALIALLGALVAIPMWYVYAFVIRHTARLLGGNGSPSDVRLALAFGPSPAIAGGLIGFIVACAGGIEFFKKEGELAGWFLWLLVPSITLEIILAIWATVCTSKCIGEVCGFSAWRGWASIVLPFLALLVVAIGVVLAVTAIFR